MSERSKILRPALRRLPIFVLVFGLVSALLLGTIQNLPRSYQASAKIIAVPSAPTQKTPTRGTEVSVAQKLAVIEHRLLTRAHLTGLTDAYPSLVPETTTPERQQSAIRKAISFETKAGRDKPTVLTLAFEHKDPVLAAQVTNYLARSVLNEHSTLQLEAVGKRLAFVHDQVAQARTVLTKREGELAAFREANFEVLPMQINRYLQRISRIDDYLIFGAARQDNAPILAVSDTPLRALEDQRDAALAVLTPQHPTVKLIENQIQRVRASQDSTPLLASDTGSTADKSLLLAEKTRLAQMVMDGPKVSKELAALERDLVLAEARFQDTVQDLAQAATNERMAAQRESLQLSLLEPAIAPINVVGPSKMNLVIVALALAFIIASAIAIWREKTDKTVRSPSDLTTAVGLAPFAIIPNLA